MASPVKARADEYGSLRAQAEAYWAEGSYQRAHESYERAQNLSLAAAEKRWVRFRLADSLWRAQAGSPSADSRKYDRARLELEAILRESAREEEHDRIWAEAQESLGDFYWDRRGSQNWGQGWTHYQQALDWWAGAKDVEAARGRYLSLVWTIARPSWAEPYYYYGYYGNILPPEIAENAVRVARAPEDKAHAHYLLAMTLQQRGEQRERVPEEFEAALKAGRGTQWYDDALYRYAEWMENTGRLIRVKDGGERHEPDFERALQLYERLTKEFKKGDSRYYDQAKQKIESITEPTLAVGVSNIFLPDSEIQFHLNWRNQKRVDVAVYAVDLPRDVNFSKTSDKGSREWLEAVDLAGKKKVEAWSKDPKTKPYRPDQELVRLQGKLAPGAYVLEAKGAKRSARELILVTDATLVVKSAGKRVLAYFCDVTSGAPIAGAELTLWWSRYQENRRVFSPMRKKTDKDGLAVFDLAAPHDGEFVLLAASGKRQAFSPGHAYDRSASSEEAWKIYAFTDRAAYRPGETAQWKIIARRAQELAYVTPAGQTLEYEITDPQGAKIKEGKLRLNQFGGAWDALELSAAMALGEYRVQFYDEGRRHSIGGEALLRLEEYKLPEFKVTIKTPEEGGVKKVFKVGETVEADVEAAYYFGGPVANATVEVFVYQNPFWHAWRPARSYPWFYDDASFHRHHWGNGQVVKHEVLKTDAAGKLRVTFPTPRGASQDFEYRIEVRVTDSSRREIVASEKVRVTRRSYDVYLTPEHFICRPQDKVKVAIRALDANDHPVAAQGTVRVTRDTWVEVWKDSSGKEVRILGPRRGENPPGKITFQGYEHEDVLAQTVKTDAEGNAELVFAVARDGYYRVAWDSEDKSGASIKAETTIWAASGSTTELGYRHGGLEIILDKDTARLGQKMPLMLTAPAGDRYVLFSVETDDLHSYQLVHLKGNVKLIEVPIEEKSVPNIFLNAAMVGDRQLHTDTKEVVVPPAEHFLSVDVKPARSDYQPREEGQWTVTTRDHAGKPVSAEVALSVVDEAVSYIQQDYAGDPRQFYYGQKRTHNTRLDATLGQKSYTKLVEGADKGLIDALRSGAKAGRDEQGRQRLNESLDDMAKEEGRAFGGMTAKSAAPVMRAELSEKKLASNEPPAPPASASAPKAGEAPVQVRRDFRATAFWKPDVVTGKDGTATIKLSYPDSLTTWKTTARAASAGSQFGIGDGRARTRMPLIVRLQAPRFFLAGDSVLISAVVNNNTSAAVSATVALKAEGLTLKGGAETVSVPANGEARVDWTAAVAQPGLAKLTVSATGGGQADAMEKTYPVYEHGLEKFLAKAGKARGQSATMTLDLPKERKEGPTELTVQVAPSLAVTMLDAVPYLIDYPYGCTEQTMSRFLPAAIVAKTLKDLGVKPEAIARKLFGGVEPEHAAKTHLHAQMNLNKLDDVIRKGLDRIYDFQHDDGGWGWWKEGESDRYMSAYVIWGLTLARQAGVGVKDGVIERGVSYLDGNLAHEEENYDRQAWMLHALSAWHASTRSRPVTAHAAKAFENVWTHRDKLNAYARALLALSASQFDYEDKAKALIRNLENGVERDDAPDTSVVQEGAQESHDAVMGTAHWGQAGSYWRWSDGAVESTAFSLRALMAIDPRNALVEPTMNWMVKNRRGAQWSNTRDTAIALLALNDYLRASGELGQGVSYELSVNGRVIADKKLSASEVIGAPSRFKVDPSLVRSGSNEIRLRRKSGAGALYLSAQARFFSLEEPVSPAGHEIFLRRQYFKYVGRPTLLKGYAYDKVPLNDGDSVKSGERVETLVSVEAKNDYEYLLLEDLKPAGLEAVEVRSGQPLYAQEIKSGVATGRTAWAYQELRDRTVALFLSQLPQGTWQLRYDMRAEVPGRFHALPVTGHAMYVPEIRANGAETRLTVEDQP
ncbi:MAG: alpha-2-macroglobulin [Elusimicrobia bacterium]|nr:alpha-2-macroglobulin [Elusimicrobiota bacterium]